MVLRPHKCGSCVTEVRDLSVRFGKIPVLDDVSFTLHCGELVAVIGPNGSGKTTLLKALLREVPYSGAIDFTVRGVKRAVPRIGYVPQRLHIDHDSPVSVFDFMALAAVRRPVWLGIGNKGKRTITRLLDEFHAGHLAKRKIGQLSGGELQRVLLAMAMVPIPDVLLLDEPVSAIDPQGLSVFYETVCDLRRKYDISILLVTHDLADAATHADRMLFLQRSIQALGTPDDVLGDAALMGKLGLRPFNAGKLAGLSLFAGKEDAHGRNAA